MTPKSNRKPFKKTLKNKVEKLEKWDRRGVLDPARAAGIPPNPPLGGYAYIKKGLLSRKRSFRYLLIQPCWYIVLY